MKYVRKMQLKMLKNENIGTKKISKWFEKLLSYVTNNCIFIFKFLLIYALKTYRGINTFKYMISLILTSAAKNRKGILTYEITILEPTNCVSKTLFCFILFRDTISYAKCKTFFKQLLFFILF